MEYPKSIKRVGRPRLTETAGQLTTRERILVVAKGLFIQRGYAAVSINEITERVSITKPTLYHYFGDKENLYGSVLKSMLEQGHRSLNKVMGKSQDYAEQLEGLAKAYLSQNASCSVAHIFKDVYTHLGAEQVDELRRLWENGLFAQLQAFVSEGLHHELIQLNGTAEELTWVLLSLVDTINIQSDYWGVDDAHYQANQLMRYLIMEEEEE